MSYEFIGVDVGDHVTTITLNRPEVMNAINPQMHDELQTAFDTFAAEQSQYLAVIKGAGDRAFCAGSDLKSIAFAGRASPYPANGYAGLIERYDLNKPVIAAVDGFALGGGFEIALACDIIIATERSSFGLPEPLVGAVALGGGVHRLARQIGLKQAMGLVLSAQRVSAEEGFRMGFVNEVASLENFEDTVARWCEQILLCAPLSIAASKEAIMRGLDEPSLESAMANQDEYPSFYRWRRSADAVEGPKAFAEKRKPAWQGK
jgi:enoyl-CoA hydratase/carnithine racemase